MIFFVDKYYFIILYSSKCVDYAAHRVAIIIWAYVHFSFLANSFCFGLESEQDIVHEEIVHFEFWNHSKLISDDAG